MSTTQPATPAPAPLIFAAMVKAMASIGHIGKNRKNTQQNYSFRGIDDLFNAVHPALVDAQIFIAPNVTHRDHQERDSKNGGTLFYETLTVEHRFYTTDGSFVAVTTMGSAMDSGDKAVNKAMSAAMKYALLEAFAIPTEGDNDTENHSPEVTPRRQSDREVRNEFESKAGVPRPTVATVAKQPAVADTMAAKSLIPSQTVATTATTDKPTKQDCDDLYGEVVAAMHPNYKVLIQAVGWKASPTMADRWSNLSALLAAVLAIKKAMGDQMGANLLEELTLGLPIDRKNPSESDAAEWLHAIVQCHETGAVSK